MKSSPVGLVDYFSDWYKEKRAIAICLHYLNRLAIKAEAKRTEEAKTRGTYEDTEETKLAGNTKLLVQELQMAEVKIVKLAQATSFREEIKVLKADSSPRDHTMQRKSALKLSSPLDKLDPFVDPDGILRVGGRLRQARLPCDVMFPAILPKESHVTNLVVKHFHKKVRHQGRDLTLNEIRSNGFWIV